MECHSEVLKNATRLKEREMPGILKRNKLKQKLLINMK